MSVQPISSSTVYAIKSMVPGVFVAVLPIADVLNDPRARNPTVGSTQTMAKPKGAASASAQLTKRKKPSSSATPVYNGQGEGI